MVLDFHFSQFLLFSESPMILPNSLRYSVIRQDLVEQVGNHERFLEYAHPLAYFGAISVRG